MAKRIVYICDGKDCGVVLIEPEDGFVLRGAIFNTGIEPQGTIASSGEDEQAFCKECMAKVLGLKA